MRLLFVVVASIVFFPSCLATKPYETPDIDSTHVYGTTPVELDSSRLAAMPWEDVFSDPQLRDLIAEALRNNLDLRDAIQQIRIAEAAFHEGKMALLPDLYAEGSASYNEPSDNATAAQGGTIPATDRYSIALSSSWELDVWGRLTSAKRARFAALLQTEATRRAVQTAIIAEVANAYYQLLALDRQLEITRATVENRQSDVSTVRSLKEGAVVTEVSVQQSIASLESAEASIPDLQQAITEQENALSILLGRQPGPIERTSLEKQEPIDSLTTGVPARLLLNRPDVIAAQYSYRSAFQQTNSARAAFYPSLTLTAEGGGESLEVEDILSPGSMFYNLIGGITQPIFANGQNEARLKRTTARQEQALLNLKSTLYNAGSDVSNALNQYRNAEQKLEARRRQLAALETAVQDSRELLQYGETNYIQVLTAQQNYLSAQLSRVNDRLERLQAGVDLYQALGGGWDRAENPVDPERNGEATEASR